MPKMCNYWVVCKYGKNGGKTHLCNVTYKESDRYGNKSIDTAYPVCVPVHPDNKAHTVKMGVPINKKTVTCKVCQRYMEKHGISSSKQQ